MLTRWSSSVGEALARARDPLIWVALAYAVGVSAGTAAVHSGSAFALDARDRIVARAASDPAAVSLGRGERVSAALRDFSENLGRGAVPCTIMGLGIVVPLPFVLYQGWVGGIVSVDEHHASRFGTPKQGLYYGGVMLLQLVPYSLAVAAGIRLGLAFSMPRSRYGYLDGKRWIGLPAEGVRDVLRIYSIVIPLFLVASLVEFVTR